MNNQETGNTVHKTQYNKNRTTQLNIEMEKMSNTEPTKQPGETRYSRRKSSSCFL
jgi:hypothetical protein